jgi:hypothetical protein
VCLDLSIPELAFVDAKMEVVATEAALGEPVGLIAGRLLLVGIGRRTNASVALTFFDAGDSDPTFGVACRIGLSGEPEIAWAQYRKPVTFELSDVDEQAFEAVAGASTHARPESARARRGG